MIDWNIVGKYKPLVGAKVLLEHGGQYYIGEVKEGQEVRVIDTSSVWPLKVFEFWAYITPPPRGTGSSLSEP